MTTPNRMRIRTSVLLAGLAIGAGLLSGCTEEKAEAPAAVIRPVKVVEIAQAATTRTLSYSGSVKSRTEMNLAFRVAGKLIERKADIGDRVKKGDVLARLDPTDYQLAVQSAEADLRSAQKALETADLANRRAKTLFAQNAIPKAQVEQAQLSYDQASATRTAAQSALEQAKNQLAYAELTSDRDGIVSAVSADRGQVVSAGAAVLTVVADDEKEVQIAVPETEISEFSPGKTVKATFWADKALALTGKVREVSGSADPQSRTFSVRISLPANDRVLIGMTAMINAEIHAETAAYAVPLTALTEKDGSKIVWTVDPAKATVHARPVQVGAFTADGVGVISGLKAGDLVVAAGTQFMRENLTVKLPDVGALAENILN